MRKRVAGGRSSVEGVRGGHFTQVIYGGWQSCWSRDEGGHGGEHSVRGLGCTGQSRAAAKGVEQGAIKKEKNKRGMKRGYEMEFASREHAKAEVVQEKKKKKKGRRPGSVENEMLAPRPQPPPVPSYIIPRILNLYLHRRPAQSNRRYPLHLLFDHSGFQPRSITGPRAPNCCPAQETGTLTRPVIFDPHRCHTVPMYTRTTVITSL